MKIKKRTIKKKEREGFPIKGRKEAKWKRSNSQSMEERERKIFRPD